MYVGAGILRIRFLAGSLLPECCDWQHQDKNACEHQFAVPSQATSTNAIPYSLINKSVPRQVFTHVKAPSFF